MGPCSLQAVAAFIHRAERQKSALGIGSAEKSETDMIFVSRTKCREVCRIF
jgi:hypothetical protein